MRHITTSPMSPRPRLRLLQSLVLAAVLVVAATALLAPTALATICVGCDGGGEEKPPPAPPVLPPYYVEPLRITVHKTEDNWGADEAYLVVGSAKWGPKRMNTSPASMKTRSFDEGTKWNFHSNQRIELYDEDSPDGDDHLGTHHAFSWQAGLGEQHATFAEDGAHYVLDYRVHKR